MAVTREQVRHLGWLARIDLSEAQLARYTGQIEAIIKYLDTLDTVPALQETEPVAPSKKFAELRDDQYAGFKDDPLGTRYRKDGFVKGPRMV